MSATNAPSKGTERTIPHSDILAIEDILHDLFGVSDIINGLAVAAESDVAPDPRALRFIGWNVRSMVGELADRCDIDLDRTYDERRTTA
ncbi:hypothetical protein [Magnetospirillum molischianum]|uniref:Uncharacterized protein n=1 Tax=Magnetospirillum molischianum DSM 120 TaxID=1150626 RepID=H8FTX8_MAGML|nr:hypothetical protein [Magnetospirillum molischianum]CCG41835.1 hypothetical protein PHAMO_290123 [Magnetospirillum molischianum DSM 120]